jgi:hypothetical protein
MTSNLRPIRGVALAAMVLLAVQAAFLLVVAAMCLWGMLLVPDHEHDIGLLNAITWHNRVADVLSVRTFFAIAAGVAVIVWLWRARTNAEIIDSSRFHAWGRTWLVVGWIVPVMNLWVPRHVVGDIWRSSSPDREMTLVNTWWALWIVFTLSDVLNQARPGPETLDALRIHLSIMVLISLIGLATAILAVLVVAAISQDQQDYEYTLTQFASGAGETEAPATP